MSGTPGGLAVIWIDWYSYHVARFRALTENVQLQGRSFGIELVGGTGVHRGLAFREELRGELPIHTLRPEAGWHEAGQLNLARALWAELNRLQPVAVLIPGYYTLPGIVAALWCRLYGRMPILMTESCEQDHKRSFAKEATKRMTLRLLFDSAIAGGSAHVQYLVKLGMKIDRIGRFYDTVDNDFFRSRTMQLRRETNAIAENLPEQYFLFAGRLAPEKSVQNLLAAFVTYRKQGGTWDLVIAGDGPLRTDLRKWSAALGISKFIHFLGHRSTDELAVLYAFASCFVLPSEREPWGLVVNEAMASNLPVLVSSSAGCAPDLVESGGNGWQFAPSDTGLLCRLMLRMSSLEAGALVRMGRRSGEIISRFSPEHWAAEVARIASAKLKAVPAPVASDVVEAL